MSKENIYTKRVDSFQGYLGFHGNISIKSPHKKWEKKDIATIHRRNFILFKSTFLPGPHCPHLLNGDGFLTFNSMNSMN